MTTPELGAAPPAAPEPGTKNQRSELPTALEGAYHPPVAAESAGAQYE